MVLMKMFLCTGIYSSPKVDFYIFFSHEGIKTNNLFKHYRSSNLETYALSQRYSLVNSD